MANRTPPSTQEILGWAHEICDCAVDERSAEFASRVFGAVTYLDEKAPDFKAIVQAAAPLPGKPSRDVAEVDGLKKEGLKALSDGVAKFWDVGPLPLWLWALYLSAAGCFAVWVWAMGGLSWAGLGSTISPGPSLFHWTFLAVPLPVLFFFRFLPACVYGWHWGWRSAEHVAILTELAEREQPRLGSRASVPSRECALDLPKCALVSPSSEYTMLFPRRSQASCKPHELKEPLLQASPRGPRLERSPVVYKGYLALWSLCARGFFFFFLMAAFITYCFLLQAAMANNSSTLHAECIGSTLVPSAPSFPPCFVRQQPLPFAAVAALAEAVNGSAGVFTLAAAPFAAGVCAPIVAAMSQKTTVYNFTSRGLLYRFGFLNSGSFENSAGTGVHPANLLFGVSWPLLVPIVYVAFNYRRLKKALSSKAWCVRVPQCRLFQHHHALIFTPAPPPFSRAHLYRYPMSIAQNLRQLIEPSAYLYFLSYAWLKESATFVELLSILLPDCFIDKACLPPGFNVSNETIKGAVHARCLVLYINTRYLGRPACLKELLAAIFHRRGRGITAALCDIGPELGDDGQKLCDDVVEVVDWDALEGVLNDAFPGSVFFDTGAFFHWVRQNDLSVERERTISWFQDHKRVSLSTKLPSTGELLSCFPTHSMMAVEWDNGTFFEKVVAFLANISIVTDPYADFPRAGMKRLLCNEVKCVPRQYGTIPDHKVIFFSNIILAANGVVALCDAILVGAPKLALAYDSAVGLVDAGAFVVDLLAILFSIFLAFVVTKALENIDPRLFYSDYLEPLCLAARIYEQKSPQPAELQPGEYDSFYDGGDFCVHIILLSHNNASDKLDPFLRALRDFLMYGLGLRTSFLLNEHFASRARPRPEVRGLVVCVLDSDEKDEHTDMWCNLLQAFAPECVVPVVCTQDGKQDGKGSDKILEVMNIMVQKDKEGKLDTGKLRKLGEEVLRALARKVGAAVLRKDIWREGINHLTSPGPWRV
jgi:hypothetical protein